MREGAPGSGPPGAPGSEPAARPVRSGIGVVGLGRLGRGVLDACDRQGRPVVLTASRGGGWRMDEPPAVVVDASAPEANERVREFCLRHDAALVECVSNLSGRQWAELARLAERVPVVRATNLTVGHYAQARLVEWLAALRLNAAFPPETSVSERHPAAKAHRPSASAVELARTWTAGGGAEVAEISSRRAGGPVSDHEVLWSWQSETLLLRHSVGRLDAAAAGALAAADWTVGRGPGLVGMRAVFDDLTRPDDPPRPEPPGRDAVGRRSDAPARETGDDPPRRPAARARTDAPAEHAGPPGPDRGTAPGGPARPDRHPQTAKEQP